MPGSAFVPCIVWVLPEDVTPYANIVTVCAFANENADIMMAELEDTHHAGVYDINERTHIILENLFLRSGRCIARRKAVCARTTVVSKTRVRVELAYGNLKIWERSRGLGTEMQDVPSSRCST